MLPSVVTNYNFPNVWLKVLLGKGTGLFRSAAECYWGRALVCSGVLIRMLSNSLLH